MTEEKRYSGSDVSTAIANACQELNTSQDKLNIEVVAPGSTGFLGLFGKKEATVKVSFKDDRQRAGEPPSRKGRGERPPKDQGRKGGGRPPEKAPAEISPADLEEIKHDLEKMLELMGFAATVTVANEANRIKARIEGDFDESLIGPEGQTLDSIQYLMRKIISRRIEGKVMFSLDAGDYREQRRRDLEEQALQLAEEVKASGRTKSIAALNPAERRIVHMTLQTDRAIRSRSVGDGHFKKILIYLPTQGKKKNR